MEALEGSLSVRIRAISAGGSGVGELPDGRVVFVPRTAPGDQVRVKLEREKPRWAKGKVLELLETGRERVPAPCPHYDGCDGCSLQHLAYRAQITAKSSVVGDALRRIGGLSVENPDCVASSREFRYRNKVSFLLRRLRGGRLVAGFHHRENRTRILDVGPECLLPEEGLGELWGRLREGWGAGARHLPSGGEIRLDLRGAEGKGSLLIQGGKGDGDPEALLAKVSGLTSVWRKDPGGKTRHLAGEPFLEIPWFEGIILLRGGAFIQVNREAGERLHRHVLELAGDVSGRGVVDAYSGAAFLGRAMAEGGASVVAIEADPGGVEAARRQAPEGFEAILGRVEDLLPEHLPTDLVLLNPPRAGLDPRVPELLKKERVPRVIYVSCDPATLARDLKRMGGGYEVRGIRSFDLFPQTSHVETVVSLASHPG